MVVRCGRTREVHRAVPCVDVCKYTAWLHSGVDQGVMIHMAGSGACWVFHCAGE